MARRTFFSFHFDHDSWRVGQVRSSNVVKSQVDDPIPFLDAADWEKVKKTEGIERWIDRQILGTSVTVVLIGAHTYGRKWVNYEIEKSWTRGNGMIGIYIHNVKDRFGITDTQGRNPFTWFHWGSDSNNSMGKYVRVYDWVNNDGRTNMGNWIELAYNEKDTRPQIYYTAPY